VLAVHTKKSLLLYCSANPSLVTAIGFGLGTLLSVLLLWDVTIAVPGMIFGGAGGGIALAYVTNRRDFTILALFGFSTAFLTGGLFSVTGFILAPTYKPFFYFYFTYILGFVISGILSALFTGSKFISVKNSTISFIVGSILGGAVIGVLRELPGTKNWLVAIVGIFVTNVTGGALSGATSKPLDREVREEIKIVGQK
jgi:hypothetical protein